MAAVLAVMLSVSACSPLSSEQVEAQLEGIEQDRSTWSLPSDRYGSPEFSLMYAARDLLVRDCLGERGMESPPVRQFDPDAPWPITTNPAGRRLFDEDIAAQFGYQEDLSPRVDWETQRALRESEFWNDDQQAEAYAECSELASKTVSFDGIAVNGFADERSMDTTEIREATERWRECMAPLGIGGLSSPFEFPTAELHYSRWGYTDDVPEWQVPPPSQDEIDIAVFDAKCRESSGWAQTVYETEWEAELLYVAKHFNELEALRAKYQEQRETYIQIIKDHG